MASNIKPLLRHGLRLMKKAGSVLKENGVRYTASSVNRTLRFHLAKPTVLRKPMFTAQQLEAQKQTRFDRSIRFSITVPLYNTPEIFLREMIQSVLDQTYGNWELCLADGSDENNRHVQTICMEYAAADPRIRYQLLEKNLGISGNTNACLELATGDYIALFDHDDLLHPAALHQVMQEICATGADYIYTDEATFISSPRHVISVHCKPDFSMDNLRANNYICHFSVFSRELLEKVGYFRPEYDGSQDHDFILRATEQAGKIRHIPGVLYYWRSHPNSVAEDIGSKRYAIDAGIHAVQSHLERRGIDAAVSYDETHPSIYRVHYAVKGCPTVTVVIPVTGQDSPAGCIAAVERTCGDMVTEIIAACRDCGTAREAAQKLCSSKVRFVFGTDHATEGELWKLGAREAGGEYIALLSCRTKELNPEWLTELLGIAQRADVGIVGGKVIRSDDTVVQAGLVLDYGGLAAGCPFRGELLRSGGYMERLSYIQRYSAVGGDCVMVKKALLDKIGGFDEQFGTGELCTADACLRLGQEGFVTVWTPHALVRLGDRRKMRYDGMYRQDCALLARKHPHRNDTLYSGISRTYFRETYGTRG